MTSDSAVASRPAPASRAWRAYASRAFAIMLVVLHAGLFLVGVAGMWEWLAGSVPWAPFSNPSFPRSILLLEWLSLIGAGALFVAGYGLRWRRLPVAMAVAYAILAAQCAVHTFGFLAHEARFREMAIEYLEYALILAYLFRSAHIRRRAAAA